MKNLTVKKGFDLNMSGRPLDELETLTKPDRVAVLPERIPFIKPRLRVETGTAVTIGTPLFEDKRDTNLVFLSPAAGTVERINFGPRRVIREIVIRLDDEEEEREFPKTSLDQLNSMDAATLTGRLVEGGVWAFLRELPFRDIASREKRPSSIIVALNSMDRFLPSPEVYLEGKEELFGFGLATLGRFSDTIHVMASGDTSLPDWAERQVTHRIRGPYPCDDPGVLLYRIKQGPEENYAWYIQGQDLLMLASLLRDGRFPTQKVVAIGGAGAPQQKHMLARIGSPVRAFVNGTAGENRVLAGGILRGYPLPADSYLGFFESSLTLIARGDEEEFFGFLRPGYKRPSFSRTFLSVFNRASLPMDSGMHGEERACVNCGYCERVCPVDILPQFTYKSIHAGEVEEYLAHGLLDCVECGLCTYVCPSKIELSKALKTAKADYYKERA